MLISISGFKNSGKDTVQKLIAKMVPGTARVAFADPLKRIVGDLYDIEDEALWGPSKTRNTPDERYPRGLPEGWSFQCKTDETGFTIVSLREPDGSTRAWRHAETSEEDTRAERLTTIYKMKRELRAKHFGYMTPRDPLLYFGTEAGRRAYPETWIEKGLAKAKLLLEGDTDVVILTDCRFVNEAEHVQMAGGQVWFVDRPGCEEGGHGSEREQRLIEPDLIIPNHYDLDYLELMVAAALLSNDLISPHNLTQTIINLSSHQGIEKADFQPLRQTTDAGWGELIALAQESARSILSASRVPDSMLDESVRTDDTRTAYLWDSQDSEHVYLNLNSALEGLRKAGNLEIWGKLGERLTGLGWEYHNTREEWRRIEKQKFSLDQLGVELARFQVELRTPIDGEGPPL